MERRPALQAKGKTVIRLRGWVRRCLTWGTKLGTLAPVIVTQQHSHELIEVYV